MLAILWLIIWATVADAFYDDYNWYTSDDGVSDQRAFDPQKIARENFTNILRNYADSYIRTREGDEGLTMAKAKSRLRMLKIFTHMGNANDYEPSKGKVLPLQEGAPFCTMGRHTKVNCNHCTCVAGQLYMCTGLICPKPRTTPKPVKSCKEGTRRKIDSCNYCYCRKGHEICSTRDCRLQHDHLLIRSQYTCQEGARRKVDCNRCVCRNGEEYCSKKKCPKKKPTQMKFKQYNQMPEGRCNDGQALKIDCIVCKCTQNHWHCSDKNCGEKKKNKIEKLLWAKCKEGTTRILDACNTCYCHFGREFCEKKDCDEEERLQYYRNLRYDEKQCDEGSYRKVDSCNYCLCLNGTEMCTNRPCPDNYLEKVSPVCKKGSVYQIDPCNYCTCQNGAYFCTKNPCEERLTSEADLLRRRKECDGWDVKYVKCNRCECLARRWVCTLKLCNGDVGQESASEDEGGAYFYLEVCKPGQKKRLDDCNTCFCRGGQWFCQIQECNEQAERLKFKPDMKITNVFEQLETKHNDNAYSDTDNNIFKPPENIGEAVETLLPKTLKIDEYHENIGLSSELISALKEANVFTDENGEEQPPCTRGSKKSLDHCNNCYCYKGLWFCENKDCGPDMDDLPPNCRRGDKIIVNCVPCTCKKQGWKCDIKKRKRNCRRDKNEKLSLTEPPQALRMTYNDDDDDDDQPLRKCKIGERYRLDSCNYCYCNRHRERVCTQDKCTTPQHVDHKFPIDIGENRCKIGSRFRKDECNYCYCNYDHQLVCSNNHCTRKSRYDLADEREFLRFKLAPKVCLPNERFRLDNCNWCYCTQDRKRICEKKPCPAGQKPDTRWPPNSPRRGCFIGSRFYRSKCEYCYCTIWKKIQCRHRYNCTEDTPTTTRKPIINKPHTKPRNSLNFECEVGQIQRVDDCNFCRCTSSRTWMCSDNVCPSNYDNHDLADEREFLREGENLPSTICKRNERFRLDNCNWCYCNQDRKRVCEAKKCPKGQKPDTRWPPNSPRRGCEIGTRFYRSKCEYCYCTVWRKIVCRMKDNCTKLPDYCPQSNTLRTKPQNSLNFECEVGQIQRVDDCNFCRCTSSRTWMCSDNVRPSNYDNLPTIVSEPECVVGEPVPAKDSCNVCICLDSHILCTDNPCIQRQKDSVINATCVEGLKYYMDDDNRCNYCVCERNQFFCTSRVCLAPGKFFPGPAGCTLGDTMDVDDCSVCVCNIKGKFDCAHDKNCHTRKSSDAISENLLSYIRTQNNKKHKMIQGTKQKCTPGKKYFPEDFDPNCPNECICDRHELLCTKRKCDNNWDQQTPLKWPLGRVEKKSRNVNKFLKQESCVEYEKLPSDDPCNACMCLNARKVCTIISCTDDNDGEHASDEARFKINIQGSKGNKGNMEKKNNTFCEPFTFFSPENNRFCRNCFCLHNGLALCLLNLCKYSKDIPHQNSPEELDEVCNPGDIGYPTKCVTCTCSEQQKWICTREELDLCQERDCDEKDEFHMGFFPYCAGCKCSVKEWFCSIQSEPCRDFSNATCPLGTFIHNPKQHCSICLCGGYEEGSHNMCFTEAKCVRQVISQLKLKQ